MPKFTIPYESLDPLTIGAADDDSKVYRDQLELEVCDVSSRVDRALGMRNGLVLECPHDVDERVEAGRFGFQHRSSERCEAVVAAPFVARRAAPRFGDERAVDQAGERGVERAGAEAQRTAGAGGDVAEDRIAVPWRVSQRQQDVELLRRQRQEGARIIHRCIVSGCIELRRSQRFDGWSGDGARA